MNTKPSEALQSLADMGFSDYDTAKFLGVSQGSTWRIRTGAVDPSYTIGEKCIRLAKRSRRSLILERDAMRREQAKA